ncbi:MAG: GNAT family N-acetyltransferase [SAR324 cluster bacterium]
MAPLKQLFQAQEFAHYAERFRGKVFVVALSRDSDFHELLLDLKVLAGYHIQVVLVATDPDFILDRVMAVSNKRGTRFHLSMLTEVAHDPAGGLHHLDLERLRSGLTRGQMPVIAYHVEDEDLGGLEPSFALGAELAVALGADKLYLVTPQAEAWLKSSSRSQILANELSRLDAELSNAGVSGQRPLMDLIHKSLGRGIPDIVVVEGRRSYLFKEVFTHDGAGLLFTRVKPSRIRPAEVKDVTDIALLLTPEIDQGRILHIDENEIERDIGYYRVYEIDGLLVGAARLKVYGNWAELAQFATLPRYRGKGRARELAVQLIEQARERKLEAVFALSVVPRMWEFFRDLGFREVDRGILPEAWRGGYDMSRPSRAFLRALP